MNGDKLKVHSSGNVDFGHNLLKKGLSTEKRKELIGIFGKSPTLFLQECEKLGLSDELIDKLFQIALNYVETNTSK